MSENRGSRGTGVSLERRDVVRATGATLAASLLPASIASASGGTSVLGDFEESLEGWKTNGGNDLTRVSDETWARPVTSGSHALEVRSDGDPYPHVYNTERTSEGDFTSNRFLLADVTVGGFEDSASALDFTLWYQHAAGNGGGKKNGSPGGGPSGRGQSPNVEEFEPITVDQGVKTTLHWDLSGLSDDERRNPKRVGIGWHTHGTKPKKGPSGRGPGESLTGSVYLDNIRLSDSLTEYNRSAIEQHVLSLQDEHGSFTVSLSSFDQAALVEESVLHFYDGTEVSTKFTAVGDGKFEYVIDGTAYRLGGGWE